MRIRVVSVALLALLLAGGDARAQKPSGDGALMPPDGFAGAYKKSAPQKVFTSADLYGHINGGAEAFLEIGFEQLTVQKYRDGSSEITVELYRMTDPAAALGVYLARCGKETPDPTLKARHTTSRHQLLLQRHRYYLLVNNTAGGAATAPMLAKAAQAMLVRMPADAPVAALGVLPAAGLVPGSARLFRGPVGLQATFTFGEGDILQLNGKLTAVAGDYRREITPGVSSQYTLILIDYPTAAAATAALANVTARLDPYLKARTATATTLVFEDFEKKFGALKVSGRRLEARLHLTKPPA